MPIPLRALWETATTEAQADAKLKATAVLKTWLGASPREEAARELGLSAVRLWQISQQAVCGLVVGCLRQPRYRGRPPKGGYGAGDPDVGALRKRIAELERDLDVCRRLIEVMKDLPGNRDRALAVEGAGDHERTPRRGRRRRIARADDGAAATPGGEEAAGGAGA
jgi:hypothetical protein